MRPLTTYSFDVQLDFFICKNASIGLYMLSLSAVTVNEHILFVPFSHLGGGDLVAQSYLTLCGPMDHSPPDSSVCGISQARVLEWVAISFSWRSFWPRDWTWIFCFVGGLLHCRQTLYNWATREAWITPSYLGSHLKGLQGLIICKSVTSGWGSRKLFQLWDINWLQNGSMGAMREDRVTAECVWAAWGPVAVEWPAVWYPLTHRHLICVFSQRLPNQKTFPDWVITDCFSVQSPLLS